MKQRRYWTATTGVVALAIVIATSWMPVKRWYFWGVFKDEANSDSRREAAAKQLARIGDARVIEILLKELDREAPDPRFGTDRIEWRGRALIEYGELAVDGLVQEISAGGGCISYATSILERIGPKGTKALPDLMKVLCGKSDARRSMAAAVLASMGCSSVPPLLETLTNSSACDKHSLWALGFVDWENCSERRWLTEVVVRCLMHEDKSVRQLASHMISESFTAAEFHYHIERNRNTPAEARLIAVRRAGVIPSPYGR